MDRISAAQLARELHTSVPRVVRAIERLNIQARRPNGRLSLSNSQAEKISRELGVSPQAASLTRPETSALAALRDAPFGLRSARAVARRSGLAPTTATRALASLKRKNLVLLEEVMAAEGRAKRVWIWRANFDHPSWATLDPILSQVQPGLPAKSEPRPKRVPRRLRHLFWNTAPSQLEIPHGGPYIARRLLSTLDPQGLAWGAKALRADDWRDAAKARGLDQGTRQLAKNLAEEAAR